jgi:bleomycin hydrolase
MMKSTISNDLDLNIENVRNTIYECKNDDKLYLSSNACQQSSYIHVSINNKMMNELDHVFSDAIKDNADPIDQNHAGLCWACAGITMFRSRFIKKYKLPKDFNFSLNHILFWIKVERSNYFMEFIIKNYEKSINSNKIKDIMYSPCPDGGYWCDFSNLIQKIGLVPEQMSVSKYSTKRTCQLNKLIKYKLREFASVIMSPNKNGNEDNIKRRRLEKGYASEILQYEKMKEIKQFYMDEIIKILYINLGEPFFPDTQFNWTYKNKKGNKISLTNLTPLKIYRDMCDIDLSEFKLIVNDPRIRHPYNNMYIKKATPIMWNKEKSHIFMNLSMKEIKIMIMKQIDNDMPIWISCDVNKYICHDANYGDPGLYDYGAPFDTDFKNMNKADRLDFCDSHANHAMAIIGYDLNDIKEKIKKEKEEIKKNYKGKNQKDRLEAIYEKSVSIMNGIRIKNSWGKYGKHDGIYKMTSEWSILLT